MKDKLKPKATAPAAKRAPKSASKSRKPAAKSKGAGARTKTTTVKVKASVEKVKKAKAKPGAERVAKRATKGEKAKAATKATDARTRMAKAKAEKPARYRIGEPVLDPLGDVVSGEAKMYLGDAEAQALAEDEQGGSGSQRPEAGAGGDARTTAGLETGATFGDAGQGGSQRSVAEEEGAEEDAEPTAPAKLERLQKILSRAGIASRRRAEEMIVAGRVMVNGQVVTQLGSKADPARDHIRVDGKLLHGAERHRYFVLNKPKGYVTTVSDPEGRPTVMEFFAKTHERLYPVGRLDYQSEGLLLMTNDGELANLLTKAGSGVEKTYLVKVAGQPSDEEMERLRGGVAIERDEAGSERVRTAPARIRKVREGENPWYEVVLTEGRNRELRKMFAAIGHFAEKIRRVGYGPLVLDMEPGKLRELSADEVNALRMTAEGKMKPRRIRIDQVLPHEAGRAAEKQGRFGDRRDRWAGPRDRGAVRRDAGGQRQFGRAEGRFDRAPARGGKPFRKPEERGQRTEWKPREREFRGGEGGAVRSGERPSFDKRRAKPFGARPAFGSREESRPLRSEEKVGFGDRGGRPPRASSDFGKRPSKPFGARPGFGGRPKFGGRPPGQAAGRFENAPRKPFRAEGGKPRWQREDRGGKKEGRPQRREFGGAAKGGDAFRRGSRPERAGIGQPGIRIDRVERPPFKPQGERPRGERSERPAFGGGGEAKRPFQSGGGKGFDKGAKFGAKPGGFAKFRGKSGGGKKFGGSRPGAARGGWKRGSTRKPQS